jgi:UPF0716 protein FxsA
MPIVILILLIGLPLVEISIFAEVGAEIGGFMTAMLTLSTAVVGVYIVRIQGLVVMSRARENMMKGEPLVAEVVHGMFLFLAGMFLVIPGFLTDSLGALLLLPPIRTLLGKYGLAGMVLGNPKPEPQYDSQGNIVIEGQYVICDDDKNSNKNKEDN